MHDGRARTPLLLRLGTTEDRCAPVRRSQRRRARIARPTNNPIIQQSIPQGLITRPDVGFIGYSIDGAEVFQLQPFLRPQDLKLRTKHFALRVIRMYSALPKNDTVAQVLGKQVLRSGTSVGANYREASRGRSKAEFISKIGDSLKEIEETEYWLELLVDSGCVSTTKMSDLLDETRQLIAIFTTIDKKAKGKRPKECPDSSFRAL